MFTLPPSLPLGGPTARYHHNVEALRVLKALRDRSAAPGGATDLERGALCLYSGWGDSAVLKLARRFEPYVGRWYNPSEDVAPLVTDEQWQGILASSVNAHYTSLDIIRAIWGGVSLLGLASRDALRILEPSAGIGHFLGAAPDWVRTQAERPVLVELDPLSAEICSYLYPEAETICSGFERTYRHPRGERTLSGWFDLCVSNVPFGKIKVADPGMHPRAATESLHNYFISRMLELTRPGGYTVAITSRYTLDGTTSAPVCRRAWAQHARLELAVRLPCDTFRMNAGTDVVTDVLFLRKLHEGESGNGDEWEGTEEREICSEKKENAYVLPDSTVSHYGAYGATWQEITVSCSVNIPTSRWYARHPDCVMGVETLTGSMYANRGRYGDLTPEAQAADLKSMDRSTRYSRRNSYEEESRRMEVSRYNVDSGPMALTERMIETFQRYLRPAAQEVSAPELQVRPAALPSAVTFAPKDPVQEAWWLVYRTAKQVIKLQVERCTDDELSQAQSVLSGAYDVATARSGKATAAGTAKAFRDRPDIHSFLLALERSDGSREAIFTRRTIFPEATPITSTDPVDALYCCLDALGRVDASWIARACGISALEAVERLGNRVYRDPETGAWVVREEYLSGNVRRKLRTARAHAMRDPSYNRNVIALETVQPKDLGPEDVSVSLKSPWVPEQYLTAFVLCLIDAAPNASIRLVHQVAGSWVLEWSSAHEDYRTARKWRTDRAALGWLLQCGMDGRTPLVYDDVEDTFEGGGKRKRRVLNQEQSVLAQAKLDDIQKEYVRWLWGGRIKPQAFTAADDARLDDTGEFSPQRAFVDTDVLERVKDLLDAYNDRFNCFVERRWDGSFLTFPGMNSEITLRKLQTDGVARVLFADRKNHPAYIWATGDGKTYGSIAAAEKRLQLGLTRKVLITVPRHLISQWADDYRRLFPGRADQILCAGKDSLTKKERGVFLSRAATGDYRVVILSHTQLKALPVRDETFEIVVREQLAQLEAEIEDQESLDDARTSIPLKRLQAMKKSLEARLTDRKERTAKDSSWTVTFEELGFDLLIGDEAQVWKNLQLVTRMGSVNGIRTGSSQISLDFLVKLRYLHRQGGLSLLATATPIANSLAEAFVFASYQQHETLREQGIETPDAFFGAFTKTYSSVELEPSCAAYRVVSRLEFGNIPELVWLLRQSWHTSKPGDAGLTLPTLATGQEIVSQTLGSGDLKAYIDAIADRVTQIRSGNVEPTEDNMLKVCSDGRWASLVNGPPDGTIRDTKLDRVVENVLRHYRETEAERGAQLVFCDLGTPTGERAAEPDSDSSSDRPVDTVLTGGAQVEQARVYEYVRQGLERAGIPRHEIEFLQDHPEPKELYRRVNAGECRVLMGSAPTGMNVQERLIALHHIDPVWRPDWKTQRDGRIVRQGNRYGTVYIYLYLTEGSFDAYMWGLVKSKLRVIEQVTYGDPTVRRIDGDVGDIVLRASEIQAIASGNPKVLIFVGVQNELTKLSALRNEYERNKVRMRFRKNWIPQEVTRKEKAIAGHKRAAGINKPDPWHVRILGRDYDKKREAGEVLFSLVSGLSDTPVKVGEYAGFTLSLSAWGTRADLRAHLPGCETVYSCALSTAQGVWTALDNAIEGAARWIEKLEREIGDMRRDAAAIERELPVGWDRAGEYARAYWRYKELAEELAGVGVGVSEFQAPEGGVAFPAEKIQVERGTVGGPEGQLLLFEAA